MANLGLKILFLFFCCTKYVLQLIGFPNSIAANILIASRFSGDFFKVKTPMSLCVILLFQATK